MIGLGHFSRRSPEISFVWNKFMVSSHQPFASFRYCCLINPDVMQSAALHIFLSFINKRPFCLKVTSGIQGLVSFGYFSPLILCKYIIACSFLENQIKNRLTTYFLLPPLFLKILANTKFLKTGNCSLYPYPPNMLAEVVVVF